MRQHKSKLTPEMKAVLVVLFLVFAMGFALGLIIGLMIFGVAL